MVLVGCLGIILIFAVIYTFTVNIGAGIGFLAILILLFVIVGAMGSSHLKEQDEKFNITKEKMESEFKKVNFKPTQSLYSCNHVSFIGLDEETKRVCFVKTKGKDFKSSNEFTIQYYSYRDLLEAHIIEDGVSTTRTSRTSQVGGALIGAVIAGGFGAVIGGLSGKTKTSQEVKNVKLQLVVRDTKTPVLEVPILNHYTELKKDSVLYKEVEKDATHWHKLISVLIKQADIEDKNQGIEQEQMPLLEKKSDSSVADEIKKLHELLKEGILTEEEFNAQKQKILSKV